MASHGFNTPKYSSTDKAGDSARNRQTKIWGAVVSVLLHVLVGLSLLFVPPSQMLITEPPVTFVELVAPQVEPPSKRPDAGEAKDEGGGGGGQAATETATESPSEPEPAAETPAEPKVEIAPQPQPTPVPEVSMAPDPAPEPKPLPSLPTPITPRLALLPAPAEIALTVTAPPAPPAPPTAPAPGFLSVAATAAAQGGTGSGSASGPSGGAGSGSGTGTGAGTGSGSGVGSGSGSGSGTGSSAARGPGASCDMLARITQAVRNAPQVRAAVDALARDADAVGQALIIWDGDWITTRGQDGRGLAGVRQAVSVTVAFAPAECKAEPVRGFVVINLGEGSMAPRVALGKAQWRWNDLLEVERAR